MKSSSPSSLCTRTVVSAVLAHSQKANALIPDARVLRRIQPPIALDIDDGAALCLIALELVSSMD